MIILSKYRAQMAVRSSMMTAITKGKDSLMTRIPNYCIFHKLFWIFLNAICNIIKFIMSMENQKQCDVVVRI